MRLLICLVLITFTGCAFASREPGILSCGKVCKRGNVKHFDDDGMNCECQLPERLIK